MVAFFKFYFIMRNYLKKTTFLFAFIFCSFVGISQNNFVSTPRVSARASSILNKVEDSLKSEFKKKNLIWPPVEMYVRSFKFDRQLEVWVKSNVSEPFVLFKLYKVCTQSGSMGPKRMEGDFQVPEGFYYINEFNPNSNYHLALGLNYPNSSDRILSNAARPGNNIYIHGNCVSTGCIPITDIPMEEVYTLASIVKLQGEQEFIPVHVFPVRYNEKKSMDYLNNNTSSNPYLKEFSNSLKAVYDKFELSKEIPVVLISKSGGYVIGGNVVK